MTHRNTVTPKIKRHTNTRNLLLLILILSLFLRLSFCLVVYPRMIEKKGEEMGWTVKGELAVEPYDAIARNILAGKGYVDDSQRINLERLPLYVYFLVLVYKAWGTEIWKLQIVQSVLDTLSCLLIFFISLQFFKDRTAALLGAAFYAVYFKMIGIVSRPLTETLYVLLLLIFIYIFLSSFKSKSAAFLSGILLGMLTLTRPITLLFPGAAVGLYFWKSRKTAFSKAGLLSLGFLLLVLPLFVRNYLLEGRVFFSTRGGKMLYLGTIIDYSKDFRMEELNRLREINEKYPSLPYSIKEDNALRNKAVKNILRDPTAYARRILHRAYLFWVYPDFSTRLMSLKTVGIAAYMIILISLAVFGFRSAHKAGLSYAPFSVTLLYFYLAHIPIYALSRFSLPVFPILFMFAGFGIANIIKRHEHGISNPTAEVTAPESP
ncbi:MAG: glycosyltransferase family 39 protein [Candidatus Aminicenantes bacterium]|nr:glycosyltransferase family 39 protein [Candidatus Aminicenantes bacterium]